MPAVPMGAGVGAQAAGTFQGAALFAGRSGSLLPSGIQDFCAAVAVLIGVKLALLHHVSKVLKLDSFHGGV